MNLFLTTLIAFIAGAGLSIAINESNAFHTGFYLTLFIAHLILVTFYAP